MSVAEIIDRNIANRHPLMLCIEDFESLRDLQIDQIDKDPLTIAALDGDSYALTILASERRQAQE